jgi:hypothetical protein
MTAVTVSNQYYITWAQGKSGRIVDTIKPEVYATKPNSPPIHLVELDGGRRLFVPETELTWKP